MRLFKLYAHQRVYEFNYMGKVPTYTPQKYLYSSNVVMEDRAEVRKPSADITNTTT